MDNPEHNQVGQQAGAAAEAGACAHTAAVPAASPRIVTTGGNPSIKETDESTPTTQAHIDWFAFTVFPPEGESPAWLMRALLQFLPILNFSPTGKGWNGYKERLNIVGLGEAELGFLALGGESQRGSLHIELNAQACALISNWQALQTWGEQHKANITRIDLAHDDLNGDTVTVNVGLAWLAAGQFNLNGRPAKGRLIDDLGSGDGKTLYIGKRANGKMLRLYEKGKQLGDSQSPWVRVEVELRNKSRVIPWDALTRPGNYLAGAYPCLAYLSGRQDKIKTITKAVEISLEVSVEHLHQTGGKLINFLMHVHSGDAFAVVNELKRPGIPQRLKSYAAFISLAENDEGAG